MMRLVKCCCDWSFVVGKRRVYGPIYPVGIGDYPGALAPSQRMMTRAEFAEEYYDCAAHIDGRHRAHRPRRSPA